MRPSIHWFLVSVVCLVLIFQVSCARTYPPTGIISEGEGVSKPVYVVVRPTVLTLGYGETNFVQVTAKDFHKSPLPNILVRAEIDRPDLAHIEPVSVMTDKDGTAMFALTCITPAPARAVITFTADGATNVLEVSSIAR